MQWCMRRGCRGCNRTPKCIDLVKIWAKSLKIQAKSMEIWAMWKSSRNPWKSVQTPKKYAQKWRPTCFDLIKMAPNVLWFEKMWPKITWTSHKWPKNFSGNFGEIRAKIFRTPKICLLLHLWQYVWRLKTLKHNVRTTLQLAHHGCKNLTHKRAKHGK